MLTEGLLATLALLGVAAGFTAVEWAQNYADWKLAGAKALSNFVHGAGFFWSLKRECPTTSQKFSSPQSLSVLP
jgi:hypothetical protein